MIVVDTSALVAIAFAEPERESFLQAIKTAGKALISTVSVVETRMVIPYAKVRWHGVIGHRQVTVAYLAGLARHHGGRFVTFDKGLVALHPDVGGAVDA